MLPTAPARRQTVLIVASVLLLHGLALWGLQSGLLQRVAMLAEDIVIPIAVLSEPAPVVPPASVVPPLRAQTAPAAKLQPTAPQPEPAPAPAPTPVAATAQAPLPMAVPEGAPTTANAPQGSLHAAPLAAAPAPAAAARVDLPSSEADYLHNPKPRYPGLSISRNEQGTVRLAVLVGVDGRAREVRIKTSSGYERLDRAAREAVSSWTFVPGKRAGVPEEMWYELPMPFRLTE